MSLIIIKKTYHTKKKTDIHLLRTILLENTLILKSKVFEFYKTKFNSKKIYDPCFSTILSSRLQSSQSEPFIQKSTSSSYLRRPLMTSPSASTRVFPCSLVMDLASSCLNTQASIRICIELRIRGEHIIKLKLSYCSVSNMKV